MNNRTNEIPDNRRVLVIDDNEAIHNDFRKILGETTGAANDLDSVEAALFGEAPAAATPKMSFDIDSAFQGEEGFNRVKRSIEEGRPYAMAFVDMRMPPGWDGVQTIKKLWEADPQLQIVICTAYSDYTWAQIANQLGMTDRLLVLKKPFDNIEVCQLAASLTEKWKLTNMVQQQTAALKSAVLHDKLTELPNRLLFNDRLTQALNRAKRNSNYKLATIFLDFDRFKIINDSFGHDVGDLLLVEIAKRLANAVRITDTCSSDPNAMTAARLGGDEFTILLDDVKDYANVTQVADRIMKVLAEPYSIKGHEIRCTASAGITTNAMGYESAEAMLRDADTAMYRAKLTGKAHYVLFDKTMHNEAIDRMMLENELHKAIERADFALTYQPIIDLESRRLRGFEALLRWKHETMGAIAPARFIPLAEETGLIVPLGLWVFDEACRQLAEWLAQFPQRSDLTVSVNLSRRQLAAPDLVERVRGILATHKVNPRQIKMEITESMLVAENETGIKVMTDLQQLGLQLHMDDFGTEFSSLSCLNKFPLDGLKIDRGFIQRASNHRKYAAVVSSIVSLARNLNIDLIAEGVETLDQVALLQSMDVRQAQGFLFAQPLDAAEATRAIEADLKQNQMAA